MMRLFRLAITLLFFATTVVFCWTWFQARIRTDHTRPSITIEGDLIEVSLQPTKEELLRGVTAFDQKDGDLTEHVIVESISKFTEPGICKVYYAVCDADDHVASATRRIRYKNYVTPEFTMNRSLCFSQMETVNVAEVIGAADVIDGDISKNVIITSTDFEYGTIGSYLVTAEVTNSKGEKISLKVPLIVEERNINAPEILLSSYLLYVNPGTPVDPMRYFVSAKDSYEKDLSEALYVESNYNAAVPGVYSMHYYAVDELGRRGHTILTVVVRGNAEG